MQITSVPVTFQKLNTLDDRFVKVKISLMHTGQNLNGSYFSKEVVEKSLSSLSNTPILGFLEDNSNGEEDFSDHRMSLTRNSDGNWKYKYMGSAYGLIPEDNQATWETKVDENGVSREYLTCIGYLWTKFGDAIDVFNRDNNFSQSMELHSDYEGYFNEKDNLFHFSSFKFFGACILGKDVNPAMVGASIETFSAQGIFSQIKSEVENLKLMLSSHQGEEGGSAVIDETNVEQEQTEEVFAETEEVVEEVEATEEVAENFESTEEVVEETTESVEVEETFESTEEIEATEEVEVEQEFATTEDQQVEVGTEFALSGQQIVDELRLNLSTKTKTDKWGDTYQEFYFVDYLPDQSVIVAYDSDDWFLVGFPYSVSGDQVTVDFTQGKRLKVEYVAMDVPYEEVGDKSPTLMSAEFHKAKMQQKDSVIEDLSQFKSNKIAEEHSNAVEELFSQFSQLTEEEIAELKEKAPSMNLEDLEVQLFAMLGKKTLKSKIDSKPQSSVKVAFNLQPDKPVGKPYDYLFEKHLRK